MSGTGVVETILAKTTSKATAAPTAYDLLRLDNQLCFALYAATRAITRTYRERLDRLNITYPQYLVLLVLWEHDGQTVSSIGGKLMLDSGTLTPLLKRMEAVKLLRRERNRMDERQVEIWLAEKGKKLKVEALEARRHVACRLDMSESEIMALRSDIMALVGKLGPECEADAAE